MSATAAGVLGGWVADAAFGDPRRGHPVSAFGAAAARAEHAAYRDDRLAGAVYAAALTAVPAAVTLAAQRRMGAWGRGGLMAAATWAALGGRSLAQEALGLAELVEAGDLDQARRRLPALVGRDPSGLDGAELCRAAVESVAENTADAIVGPLVYGALAGPAGVVAHRCANTLDAMVGHRSPRYEQFGWAAARLDDLLGWLPARLTAALAVALAPSIGGDPRAALATWLLDGHRHPSPNAGRAEAAFAGALDVRLGGENRYAELEGATGASFPAAGGDQGGAAPVRISHRGPLGDGPASDPAAVRRAVRLSRAVSAAAAALCVLAVWGRGRRR
ncbi:MAG TPA: adenosylcobinamide-phosphate synthase CbiB [Egibacteraceae bacterium]|nr:adenosylcobinamide-phosphate synthase CbiB [Egibacteraceae bacterium]